jgi:acetoacetyl-CoA synthetase
VSDDATSAEPLWAPGAAAGDSQISRFQEFLASSRGLRFVDYDALWRWSVEELEEFWAAVWEHFDLDRVSGYDSVLASEAMPGARWFTGAGLNFASYLLDQGAPEDSVIVDSDESGVTGVWTRAELRRQVAALAASLRSLGVTPGDRVVGYLPNVGETIVAFLATASLGAVWSSVGQDYAAAAVVDRFGQLEPTVLVTASGYRFNGKVQDRNAAVDEVRAALSTLTATVLLVRRGIPAPADDGSWHDWAALTAGDVTLDAVTVPFDHPLWVLFSSGTTGLPKGLVHGHGGVLVETLKQMALHWDLGADDRVFWYTSPSWVMWNLQMSTLIFGGSVVCYDGSPTYPGPSVLWKLVADTGVTFFGTSPGYLQATEKAGLHPASDFELSALRAMGSTGSPLPAGLHRWARENVGNLPLWSMSGGTDVAGAFVGGVPTVPIWPGELSVRCLGVALEAWDDQSRPVVDAVGEMVIRRPMPSMPVSLWNDPTGSRLAETYYTTFPGVWRQGDWITVTSHGSVVIHGRSDSTLNRNGVRMGSADIYAAVETVPEIVEALVIGAEQSDGSYWMPLFVVLRDDATLDDQLVALVRDRIREKASPRHVPDEIIAVPGIPHTRTGKKLELPVKRLLQGATPEQVAKPGAVDRPDLLNFYAALARSSGSGVNER